MTELDVPIGAACRIDAVAPGMTIAEVPVGLDPEGVAVDLARGRVYVACSRADNVAVVDLETHETVARIPVGAEPIDLAYDPATDRIFTANAHSDSVSSVSVIDLDTLETIATVEAEVGAGAIAFDRTRNLVICVNFIAASATFIDT